MAGSDRAIDTIKSLGRLLIGPEVGYPLAHLLTLPPTFSKGLPYVYGRAMPQCGFTAHPPRWMELCKDNFELLPVFIVLGTG